jgi:methionyl-tRNA synthetase
LSITKDLLGADWEKWWKNPDNVELFHFIGKDNVAFHAVMFPATEIGTGDNFTMVRHLCATEYLNYEDKKFRFVKIFGLEQLIQQSIFSSILNTLLKFLTNIYNFFSKSRGTGVFCDQVSELGIPADVWRFYLIYMRPETQDTAFLWDDFMMKVNTELLNNLGNFVNRALVFVEKFFDGVVPEVDLKEAEEELLEKVDRDLQDYIKNCEDVKLRDALQCILSVSRHGNQYIQANQPWVLVKGSEEEKYVS